MTDAPIAPAVALAAAGIPAARAAELRDRPELFDVFVLPQHRGSPAGRLLTAAAVRWAAGVGFPLRGHVVGDDDNAATVRRRLLASGWRPAESYWAVPAAGGG